MFSEKKVSQLLLQFHGQLSRVILTWKICRKYFIIFTLWKLYKSVLFFSLTMAKLLFAAKGVPTVQTMGANDAFEDILSSEINKKK